MENNNNSSSVSVFVLVLVVLVSFAAGFFTGSIVEHLRKTLEDIKKNAKEIDKYFDDIDNDDYEYLDDETGTYSF